MATAQEKANWKPLEDLAVRRPQIRPCEFMFMGLSGEIHLYKHVATRRYINVHPNGDTFGFDPETGDYNRVSNLTAVAHVLT
ncbi:MAG: hypothetical protein ABSG53_00150 [Thermoguttaceae bacterium]|jgi:hypothetical protein